MDQGTCEECGQSFDRTFSHKRFCCESHQRKAQAKRYRASHTEQAECKQCGTTFTRSTTTNRKKLHCSDECSFAYRAATLGIECDHGVSGGASCPACTFVDRAQATQVSVRSTVKADPCAYCGSPTAGIDHIEPSGLGGTDEWTNWTGCCHRCNAIKGQLPLLEALMWIPVNREYHDLRRTLFG